MALTGPDVNLQRGDDGTKVAARNYQYQSVVLICRLSQEERKCLQ
jgi:hypothetical protein